MGVILQQKTYQVFSNLCYWYRNPVEDTSWNRTYLDRELDCHHVWYQDQIL